jgi:integrase
MISAPKFLIILRRRIMVAHTLTDDGLLGEVKRARSRRTIVIPGAAVAILHAHKAAQARLKLLAGSAYQDNGFVFANELGLPWKCHSLGTLFGRIVKRAGVASGVHPHTLRHSYASLALKAGVPITTLAATLGHDVQTLMAIYSHHLPSAEDSAAGAMEKALA